MGGDNNQVAPGAPGVIRNYPPRPAQESGGAASYTGGRKLSAQFLETRFRFRAQSLVHFLHFGRKLLEREENREYSADKMHFSLVLEGNMGRLPGCGNAQPAEIDRYQDIVRVESIAIRIEPAGSR